MWGCEQGKYVREGHNPNLQGHQHFFSYQDSASTEVTASLCRGYRPGGWWFYSCESVIVWHIIHFNTYSILIMEWNLNFRTITPWVRFGVQYQDLYIFILYYEKLSVKRLIESVSIGFSKICNWQTRYSKVLMSKKPLIQDL